MASRIENTRGVFGGGCRFATGYLSAACAIAIAVSRNESSLSRARVGATPVAMTAGRDTSDTGALGRAQAGDRNAFEQVMAPHLPMLRSVIRRLIAHPEDTDDLVQDTLLLAFQKLDSFREEAKLSTWLCTIGTRMALDYLRGRKPWRLEAQLLSKHESYVDSDKQAEIVRVCADPDYAFDAREHIAYCFSCVARTLEPEQEIALVLRDVMGYSTRESAKILGLSESVLRHRLASARSHMRDSYEDLCALVSKRGVCWQCKGLRERNPEGKRGPEVPALGAETDTGLERFRLRLQIVRDADVDSGRSQAFHDVLWRRMSATEQARNFAHVLEQEKSK